MSVGGIGDLGFQVNRENVLGVYQLVQSEADRLDKVVQKSGYKLRIDLCGGDPVSKDAMETFNAELTRLRTQCEDYVRMLFSTAAQLKQTALSYGFTEEQIAHSLNSATSAPAAQPPPTPILTPQPNAPVTSLLKPYLPAQD